MFAESAENEQFFDMSLEQLLQQKYYVSTASKYQQKISDAPASVTVITADEIRKHGYRNIADALDNVPGFYINYDRNYHYLGVRGFRRPGDYDTRILVLIDGHRVNENIGDGPGIGTLFPVDVDMIDKIEVIRGPGSSLYGSNALLAVINIITRSAKQLQGLEVSGQVASFNTWKGRASYGRLFNNGNRFLVSATGYDSDGPQLYFKEFDDPSTRSGIVENDDNRFHNLFTNATFGDFSLTAAYTTSEKGIPTAPWDTVFGDKRTRTNDDTTLIGLAYDHRLSDKSSVKARVVYHHYDYDGTWPYNYAEEGEDPDIVVNGDSWIGQWWETELQFISEPIEKHRLTWGAEGRYNIRQDQKAWDESTIYLDDRRHSTNWGIYFQDEFTVLNNLTFIGGVRYDNYETFGGTVNPRLAFIYDILENTTIKLLYGKAFRAPNAYELYFHDGNITQKASLDLKPETIRTHEVVLEHQINQDLRATISGFHYVMEDLIDQYLDPDDGLLVFKNIDKVNATGVETALEGTVYKNVKSRCSYSYMQAKDEATDQLLVNSPRHLAKLNLTTPLLGDNFFAGLGLLYCSKAKTLSDSYADNFLLVNLVLTYENILKGMELSIGLYNLFDTEYGYPGSGEHTQDVIYQDGRTFMARLIYRIK